MIPVIDFKKDNVLEEIRKAYTTVGFAVFTNTLNNTDSTSMTEWFEVIKTFFDLPLETKKKYAYQPELNQGYSVIGEERVDLDAPEDINETFNYNPDRMTEDLWPTEIANFKDLALNTIRLNNELTNRILHNFDCILGTGDLLVDAHKQPHNNTRIIHYPAYDGPIKENQKRIGEHTDYGTLTLLWQINDVPGLQVKDLKGDWHPVPYKEGGVIVNIGDILQRWTNDYFVSTYHRVVNSHIHLPRYSMPHFVDPTPGTVVKNLTNAPSKYEPIESLAYLKWRLAQSY